MIDPADERGEQKSGGQQGEETNLVPEESPPAEERSPLEILQSEYDDLHDRYLRLAADFDNFRKRSARDAEYRTTTAIERFARDMLEIADSLDRAIIAEGADHEGMCQIRKLLENVLERQGITGFDSAGTPFDPVRHEAVAYIPAETEEGTVCNEVCRGYCLNSRVIRPAKVTVSRGKEPQQS